VINSKPGTGFENPERELKPINLEMKMINLKKLWSHLGHVAEGWLPMEIYPKNTGIRRDKFIK